LAVEDREGSHLLEIRTAAIIPAAGAGLRFGGNRAKQFLELDGKPILAVTLEKFQHCPAIDGIILVVPEDRTAYCGEAIVEKYRLTKVVKIVPGGERRQDSVRYGIQASDDRFGLILIHDGVRPLVRTQLIERVVEAAKRHRAVITALPAKETVKAVAPDGLVTKTFDRSRVWLVQTPQAFRYEDIRAAHEKALAEGWDHITDDALLMERVGIPVKVIKGTEDNIKVTTPHDLELATFLQRRQKSG
jgi:2-C-methyl-D-erythritol 4-phosphate cytidylyltransferase